MTTPAAALAARLEQVVRRVPSVRGLYRPWWAMAGHRVAAALGIEDEQNPLVTVGMLPDGSIDVTAAIATTAGAGAADTCRAVHDAIAADLREQGHPNPTVHVTVVQVAPAAPWPQNTGRPPVTPSTVPDT